MGWEDRDPEDAVRVRLSWRLRAPTSGREMRLRGFSGWISGLRKKDD